MTAIVHFEGADALASDLSDLADWYERGLRSIGLVWSRPNAFAEGVPFEFPASPDTGAGPDGGGDRAGARLQRARHPRRPVAPQRGGLLGRRAGEHGAACRDAFERARSVPLDPELDRRAARRGRRGRTVSSASTSRAASCARTGTTLPTRHSRRSSVTSTTSSSGWGSNTSRSARTSTAPWCRPSSAESQGSPNSSLLSPAEATTKRRSRS